jgi:hypothetical protein
MQYKNVFLSQNAQTLADNTEDRRVHTTLTFIEGWTNLNLEDVIQTLNRDGDFRYYYFRYTSFQEGHSYQEMTYQSVFDLQEYIKYTSGIIALFQSHQVSLSTRIRVRIVMLLSRHISKRSLEPQMRLSSRYPHIIVCWATSNLHYRNTNRRKFLARR